MQINHQKDAEAMTPPSQRGGKPAIKSCITKRSALMLFIVAVILLLIFVQNRLPSSPRTVTSPRAVSSPRPVRSPRDVGRAKALSSSKDVSSPRDESIPGALKEILLNWTQQHYRSPRPTADSLNRVPMIFHQTYGTVMVRNEYKPYVNSCLHLNPNWQYYLWRDVDIQAFIQDHYPWMLQKYNGLRLKVERGDIIRYMALYYYGGIYLDMDIQCAKPFFPSLESMVPLFFDQERKEQAHMLYGHKATIMNSAMGSVPGHPFFLELLLAINATPSTAEAPLWTTGPLLMTDVYNNWTQGPEQAINPILLLEPEVFSPIMDNVLNFYEETFCRKVDSKALSQLTERQRWVKRGCDMIRSKNWRRDTSNPNVTVGRHMFKHFGWHPEGKIIERFDIRQLHPAVKMYKEHGMLP